jgi:hypothetical protein
MPSETTRDIVSRLRRGGGCADVCRVQNAASGCECAEAADEIERLRLLNAELKADIADASAWLRDTMKGQTS